MSCLEIVSLTFSSQVLRSRVAFCLGVKTMIHFHMILHKDSFFKTEAQGKSEMAHWLQSLPLVAIVDLFLTLIFL